MDFIWLVVAILTGAIVIALTSLLMGWWLPVHHAQSARQTASSDAPPLPAASDQTIQASALSFRPATVDVLAQLAAKRVTPWVPALASQSVTLSDALQRAMEIPVFDSLAIRTDPEALFETAAWAEACRHGGMSDAASRCGDSRLHDPGYADRMLARAAGAGQAGAIIELAMRYPTSWNSISMDNGVMLDDALYMLAQHGNLRALDLLRQWCTTANHCEEPMLTRNVLMLLMFRATSATYESSDATAAFEGDAADRQRAEARAARISLLH
ncbi:hypothetical protein [Paraburkholderia humisilvae]|nr:hypothetical protein [Paraburkholderia humisilvae]